MRSAPCAIDHVGHSGAQLLQRVGRKVQRPLRAHLVRAHDLVIECLHLLHQARLIKRAAIRDDAHRLRHLQRRHLDIPLTD